MAQRTAVEKVRAILPADTLLTDPQIQAAIDAATCLVDRMVLSSCGQGLSEACLIQIETYLAAHFCAVTENTLSLSSESSDGCCKSSVKYGFKFGEGIKGTPFGQMANTLSGGCLAEFDKQPVNFFSIGAHGGSAGDYN